MMDDNLLTNLDLNRNPFGDRSPPSRPETSPPGFGSFTGEHETPQRAIEDRIKMIQAVSDNSTRRRRVVNNQTLTFTSIIEPIDGENGEGLRNHKRDLSHLTKALGMDLDANNTVDEKLFDCNICLGMAKDPILTCCGHLFCWGCFCQVPYVDSISKECPVCKGEVVDFNVTPVYGNGNVQNSQAFESNSRVRIPARPQAHRVESVSHQNFDRLNEIYAWPAHSSVSDALGRIRAGVAMVERNPPLRSDNRLGVTNEINLSDSVAAEASRVTSVGSSSSVDIEPEAQRAIGNAVLHLGTLAADGSVEIDLDMSSSRRSVVRALSSEVESSLEVRRRRLR